MKCDLEYLYICIEGENKAWQMYKTDENRFVAESCTELVNFNLESERNKNAQWFTEKHGKKTWLYDDDGYEWEVYTDVRDVFGV